jgi:hypothetical protein
VEINNELLDGLLAILNCDGVIPIIGFSDVTLLKSQICKILRAFLLCVVILNTIETHNLSVKDNEVKVGRGWALQKMPKTSLGVSAMSNMAILDMHPLKRGAPLVHSDFPK